MIELLVASSGRHEAGKKFVYHNFVDKQCHLKTSCGEQKMTQGMEQKVQVCFVFFEIVAMEMVLAGKFNSVVFPHLSNEDIARTQIDVVRIVPDEMEYLVLTTTKMRLSTATKFFQDVGDGENQKEYFLFLNSPPLDLLLPLMKIIVDRT